MANSGEISGELKSRFQFATPIDRAKPNPSIVTPAADHWVNDVNTSLQQKVLDVGEAERIAKTYIGIVTSREMAQCLGWPDAEIGFADVVRLATDPQGWSKYPCARADWGPKALLAFTYPDRSSTARSVLFTLYAIAAGKPAEQLTMADASRPDVGASIRQFQNAIDCYVPDTLDLNQRILGRAPCAQFFFIAEDNLVQLYQGKVCVPQGDKCVPTPLDRDLVMIYPKEGSIVHNHSGLTVSAPWLSADEIEAAGDWISFLREDAQQLAFMQEGFRPTTALPCVSPVGSPFSQCTRTPAKVIYPDQIDPLVAQIILESWKK
jgi:Ca-activated chloride channel family protein